MGDEGSNIKIDSYASLPDPVEAWLIHEWPVDHDDRAREALRELLEEIRADEREACAKECEAVAADCRISGERYIANECAGAVRDRTTPLASPVRE